MELLVGDLSGLCLGMEDEPTGLYGEPNSIPMECTASSSPTLLPHRLFTTQRQPSLGLNNASSTYSALICPSIGMHEDPSRILLHATMELATVLPASEDLGFS
jgi:hypothetical protein